MKKNLLAFLTIITISSCSILSFEPSTIDKYDGLTPDTLTFKMGFCLSGMRQDLYRQTTTEESTDTNGNTTTETKDVAYHPLGLYLCKGIFLDLNHNLYIDIAHLAGVTENTDYTIVQEEETLCGTYTKTTQKSGNQITTKYNTLFGDNVDKIDISDEKITIQPQCIICNPDEILIADDELIYHSTGTFKKWSERKIKQAENGYIVPNLFGNFRYTGDEYSLTLDRYFDVTSYANYIEFRTSKWNAYYWVKTSTGYVWQTKSTTPITIDISPNSIVVTRYQRHKTTYTIEEPLF